MILVTGATGLIGAHLTAHLLLQNKNIVALKRPNSKTENIKEILSFYTPEYNTLFNKIRFVDGDVTDIFSVLDALEGVKEVYHCAGMVSFEEKKIKELLHVNEFGTANMVNACLEKEVKQFCHVSSVATMPNHDKKPLIDESVFWKSSPENGAYAISKYNAEREVWRGNEEGLAVCIVNPSVVIGAGCWGQSSTKMFDECYKGTRFYTNGSTGFVDVRDVAKSMITLMEQKVIGKRFVVNGENKKFKEVVDILHSEFEKKLPSIEAKKWLLKTGGFLERMFVSEPRLNKQVIDALLSDTIFSNEQIKKQTGINFTPINETLHYVAEKYKNHRKSI